MRTLLKPVSVLAHHCPRRSDISGAYKGIKEKSEQVLKGLEAWKDVSLSADH